MVNEKETSVENMQKLKNLALEKSLDIKIFWFALSLSEHHFVLKTSKDNHSLQISVMRLL